MSRTPIVGGNWKMNLDLVAATQLAASLRSTLGAFHTVETVVFPPYPFLHPVFAKLRGSSLGLGGQDVHTAKKGAFTSGVSGSMLRSVGCEHVLVGHSERRAVFGDSDAVVAAKLQAALDATLRPVLCVGETLDERDGGRTLDVIRRQLDTATAGHTPDTLSTLVVAYEPVWAIGTGRTATPAQAQETHAAIRAHIATRLGSSFAGALRLQYGGSVTADNAAGLLSQPDIDGALVGGASLDAASFARIVRAAAR